MTHRISFIILVLFLISFNTFAQSEQSQKIHIGLLYPLSTNGTNAGNISNDFSLHAITGLSKDENHLAIYGFAGVVKNNVNGVQLAGFANIVNNEVNGLQAAGFLNLTRVHTNGAQLSGFANISGGLNGLQVAGFANVLRSNGSAKQIAGFANKAGDIKSQIAGFINIAQKVKGVQIAGFINIADSSDYPIGVINIIKNGEKYIGLTADETLTSMVSFRSGGRILYGIVGAGYNMKHAKDNIFVAEAGIGAHIPITHHFRTNIELASLFHFELDRGEYYKAALRILPAYTIGRCEIFAGPTLNHVNYEEDKGRNLVNRYVWSHRTNDNFNGLYVGLMGGIHFRL